MLDNKINKNAINLSKGIVFFDSFFFLLVSSGSISINEDSSVQILAEEAHPLENLDPAVSTSFYLTDKYFGNPSAKKGLYWNTYKKTECKIQRK